MKRHVIALGVGVVAIACLACYSPVFHWMDQALSGNPQEAEKAIKELRSHGPYAMEEIAMYYGFKADDLKNEKVIAYRNTIDAVAQQKDSYYSKLFWYTDIEEAKTRAQQENKPILSLRMLGNLTDELSCTNSRMFRTILYPNKDVSEYLKRHYVLHWSSERPVPVVSIDFGDGRSMKTTLTGNSIHYVLDKTGKPIEGIPGLYSPSAFLSHLKDAKELYTSLEGKEGKKYQDILTKYHGEKNTKINQIAQLYRYVLAEPGSLEASLLQAERLTVSKSSVEMPVVDAMDAWGGDQAQIQANRNQNWTQVAAALGYSAKLDESSRQMMRDKNPVKLASDSALEVQANTLEQQLLVESAMNELSPHRMIHEWFINGSYTGNFSTLNEKVYAELFFTPRSDTWLGLLPDNVYTGLTGDGVQIAANEVK